MEGLIINLGKEPMVITEKDLTKGLPVSLSEKQIEMGMTVDASADYATNAKEYFTKAMIGEESTRSKFRALLGVKELVKLGTIDASTVTIKPGATAFNPDGTTASQKEFRAKSCMIGTEINISELEEAFMSDQIAKGSNNFSDKFEFMNFFYSELDRRVQQAMEKATWTGTTVANGFDGLEVQMTADAAILKPTAGNGGVASAITDANVIAKLKQARDVITGVSDGAVIDMPDFVYIVSKDVYNALADSVSENKASGLYYLEGQTLTFQGLPIYKSRGATSNLIIATYWSNLLNIQDLLNEENGFHIVDFMKTILHRKIGVRVDFKFNPTYVNPEEIYYHNF